MNLNLEFFLRYLKNPALIGAILPSTSHLANALCRQAMGARFIVELGAGTGAVTHQLRATFPNLPMVLVEQDKGLAEGLTQRFGRCKVVGECVHENPQVLQDLPADTVLVSSLPFRSMPPAIRTATLTLICQFLLEKAGRKLVQFTYGVRPPFESTDAKLTWQREEVVLRNLPPASVWTLAVRAEVPTTAKVSLGKEKTPQGEGSEVEA
jgi:phosphatidylethanolamine/phosphatidyl-N-methylethanolamine N-methyltransferase